jgi:hypothetical protein
MSVRLRIVLVTVLCAIAVLGAVTAYFFHNPDRYLPRMIAYVQKKTGQQVEIRHMALKLFPLRICLYDVGIKNPKPFPPGYFLKAPAVDASIEFGPLLHRTLSVQSLVLDHPVINFISDPDGLWNFQSPVAANKPVSKPPRFSLGAIAKLEIKKGKLLGSELIDPADTPGPIVLDIGDFSAQLRQINFDAFRDPSTSSPVTGNLEASTARFGDVRLRDLRSQLQVLPEQLTFKDFTARTYRGHANGDFTFNFKEKNPKFNTDFQISGIGINYLLAEFQSGPATMTGMMQGEIKLTGDIEHTSNPLAGITGGGNFTIRNGEFPNLRGNKHMAEMKRFRNPEAADRPLSAFSSFVGDMELENHHIYNKKVDLDLYGIIVDGAGSLNEVNGGMNYRGTAIVLKKQGFFTNVLAKWFKRAKEKNGKLTFPIRVAGTLTKPALSIVD